MRSIAELFEITSEILQWEDRRIWWVNQRWIGVGLIVLHLTQGILCFRRESYVLLGLCIAATGLAVYTVISAVRGIKRVDRIIEKLKESMVAP